MNKMLNVQDFILDAYKTYSATVFKAIRFTLLLFILMIACFVIAHYAVEDIMLKSKVFLVIAIIMVPVYIFLPLIGQIKCAFGYYKANSEVNPDTSYEHAYATDLIGPSFRKFLPVLFAALLMSVPVSLVSLCMYLAGVKSVLPYVIVNFISLLTLFFTSVFVMPFIALEEENPIKAFKRSAMLIIPNLHSVALCLFLSICVFLAIYIPLSLMSYFLRAFLASHIQEIVISIVMMGQFMAILTIIGFLLLSKSITIAINYIPITMYSVLFGKLLEVEQAFKINTTKRPEDIKLKTTTQKVKHDIDEKILNRIESTQSVISSIDQLNEGENK